MRKNALLLLLVGLLSFVLPGRLWAAEETDEKELQEEQREIDSEPPAKEADRVNTLAEQFDVPPATVQDLRNKGQGWGEITIGLSMANRLTKTDSATYPTSADALQKVQTMRDDGAGWGKIAKDLGFKLGPVVSETKSARKEFREKVRSDKPERAAKVEKSDRSNRPERTERPNRPERPDHVKPHKAGR